MLAERAPEFSQEESEEIGIAATQLANAGEGAIYTAIGVRHWLMGKIINIYRANMYKPNSLEWLAGMQHEVAVMDEVVRRARTVLKIQGTDLESEGRRAYLAASFGHIGDSE